MLKLRYIIGFVLLFFVGSSFADSSAFNFDYLGHLTHNEGSSVDISIQLLTQVFGRVGMSSSLNSLPSGTVLALGHMFGELNKSLVGLIGLFTCYGVFAHAIRSAHDGMQGQNSKAGMALLRVVLGVSLVLPSAATGYSMAQRIVMDAAVYGAGVADDIYDQVFDGMSAGVTMIFSKSGSAGDASTTANFTANSTTIGAVISAANTDKINNLYDAEVCSAMSNLYYKKIQAVAEEVNAEAARVKSDFDEIKESEGNAPSKAQQAGEDSQMKKQNPLYAICRGNQDCKLPISRGNEDSYSANVAKFAKTYISSTLGIAQSAGSGGSSFGMHGSVASAVSNSGTGTVGFSGFIPGKPQYNTPNNNNCGSFIFDQDLTSKDKATQGQLNQTVTGPSSALLDALQGVAESWVNLNIDDSSSPQKLLTGALNAWPAASVLAQKTITPDQQAGVQKDGAAAAVSFAELSIPYMKFQAFANQGANKTQMIQFVKYAKNAGWTGLGRYYFDMIRLNNYVQSIKSDSTSAGNIPLLDEYKGSNSHLPINTLNLMYNNYGKDHATDMKEQAFTYGTGELTKDKLIKMGIADSSAQGSADPDNSHPSGAAARQVKSVPGFADDGSSLSGETRDAFYKLFQPMLIGLQMIKPMISAYTNVVNFFTQAGSMSGLDNPIVFCYELGQKILGETLKGLMITNGVIFYTSLAANMCSGQNPLGAATNNALAWSGSMTKTMVGPMIAAGGVLAYYVPFYPFIMYTHGVISWIINIVDAMVSIPLVCLGIAHPEGNELLGKGEQAVMMLVSVFLRPAVMVFAMVAAIAVSYVGVRLVNVGFLGTLMDGYGTGMQMVTADGKAMNEVNLVANYTSRGSFLAPGRNKTRHADDVTGDSQQLNGGAALVGQGMQAAVVGAHYDKSQNEWSSGVMPLVTIPLLLIVYTLMIYGVITQSFGMVSELVNGVMKWVGATGIQDNGGKIADMIKGATQSAGSQIGGMAGGSGKALHKMGEAAAKDTKKTGSMIKSAFSGSGGDAAGGAAGGDAGGGANGAAGGTPPAPPAPPTPPLPPV